jgi:YesN/AraC family two-component response regulator
VAESYGSASKHIDAETFDLVITDLRLGDGDGLDLADAAKAAGMRTLIVSGYVFQYPPERLARHRYLWKPVRVPELLKAVAELLAEPA